MYSSPINRAWQRFAAWALSFLAGAACAQTQVYRCTDGNGRVSYQAQACAAAQTGNRLDVPGRNPTAAPPAPPAHSAMPAENAQPAPLPTSGRSGLVSSRPAGGSTPRPQHRVFEPVTARQAYQAAHAAGLKLFNERCKTAGKAIGSPVEDLLEIRLDTVPTEARLQDPDWLLAGLPEGPLGDKFIASFLDFDSYDRFVNFTVRTVGFRQVDVQHSDGSIHRHRLAGTEPGDGMTSRPIPRSQAARYALSMEPLGTPQERAHWVAGTRFLVTDTQTQRLVGEMRTFSFALPPEAAGADLNARNWGHRLSCTNHGDIREASARLMLNGIAEPHYPNKPRPKR